jgi:hypothetical protein
LVSYMYTEFVLHRKHSYGPPLPATGIALVSYMYTVFVLQRKQAYGPPRPVTEIALHFSRVKINLPFWWT